MNNARSSRTSVVKKKKSSPSGINRKKSIKSSKKSTVDAMALKIGLNVVPPIPKRDKTKRKRTNGKDKSGLGSANNKAPIPVISWGKGAEGFFWGDNIGYDQERREGSHFSSKGRQIKVQPVPNDNKFPLYLIRNVLSRKNLKQVLSQLMDDDIISLAEEMEQHELVRGQPRTLRRSMVSQLTYHHTSEDSVGNLKAANKSREIMDLVKDGLPEELAKGMGMISKNHLDHPYEDGSVVYYRSSKNDFYESHHDSYDPRDPPRKHQRAYTILLYVFSPTGSATDGGTEFVKLSSNDSMGQQMDEELNMIKNQGIVVKPKSGDALVWPNFDKEGKPYMDSIHKALPIAKGSDEGEDIGKIVINLWFEGYQLH